VSTDTPSHQVSAPSAWVERWTRLLPDGASVLDVACGSGRHALPMAQRGLQVTALDRDSSAIEALRGAPGVAAVIAADIENDPWPLEGRQFDAVVVTNYLWRPLWHRLLDSLASDGMLIYETFNVDQARLGRPTNPDFLLRHGELLELCAQLRIVAYEDGLLNAPERAVQRIVAVRLMQPGSHDAAPVSAPLTRLAL
jgi:SAM-dependent methyltransferase